MKTKLLIFLHLFFSLMTADLAYAVSVSGHFAPGGSGIRPSQFPTIPSFVYRAVIAYQDALSMRDGDGNSMNAVEPFEANGISIGHKFVYTPDFDVIPWLGNARYHTHLIVPTTFVQMSAAGGPYDHSFGVGDPSFFPLDLTWDYDNLQISYSLGGFLPIGHYDKGNGTSLGKNFWTLVNILGFSWWIDEDKDWCLSAVVRYEKHYTKKHTDFRQGDDLSFEWSISRNLNKNWELGLVGVDVMQVRDDKGVDDFGRSADIYERDELHSAGLELQYTNFEHAYQVALRGMRDYKVEGKPETWNVALTLTFMFF